MFKILDLTWDLGLKVVSVYMVKPLGMSSDGFSKVPASVGLLMERSDCELQCRFLVIMELLSVYIVSC